MLEIYWIICFEIQREQEETTCVRAHSASLSTDTKCILSTHSFDTICAAFLFFNHFRIHNTNDERRFRIYSSLDVKIIRKLWNIFIWLPAFECCWWCAGVLVLMRFFFSSFQLPNEFYVHVNHPQSSNWKICWGPISKRILWTIHKRALTSLAISPCVGRSICISREILFFVLHISILTNSKRHNIPHKLRNSVRKMEKMNRWNENAVR